jgi:hypothetical protein
MNDRLEGDLREAFEQLTFKREMQLEGSKAALWPFYIACGCLVSALCFSAPPMFLRSASINSLNCHDGGHGHGHGQDRRHALSISLPIRKLGHQ